MAHCCTQLSHELEQLSQLARCTFRACQLSRTRTHCAHHALTVHTTVTHSHSLCAPLLRTRTHCAHHCYALALTVRTTVTHSHSLCTPRTRTQCDHHARTHPFACPHTHTHTPIHTRAPHTHTHHQHQHHHHHHRTNTHKHTHTRTHTHTQALVVLSSTWSLTMKCFLR
jgi:hypothetical protein